MRIIERSESITLHVQITKWLRNCLSSKKTLSGSRIFMISRAKKKAMKDRFDKALIDMLSPLQSLVPTSSGFIESEDEDRKLFLEQQVRH